MINRSERSKIQTKLLNEIGVRIADFGFNAKPAGQSFYRKVPSGKWAFHISFIPHKDDFDLTADVAVRNDAIENIVNKYDSKVNSVEGKNSMTLGAELGNLSVRHPLRWTIAEPSDISHVVWNVINAFERIGLPFLQKYSELSSIREVLQTSDPDAIHLAPILGPRYMRAIAAVYLLGGKEELSKLIQQYDERLERTGDLYLKDFRILGRGLVTS